MSSIVSGVADVFQLLPLMAIFGGVVVGIIFGSIPGLTATMAIALCLPLTFGVDPVISLSLLVGLFVGAPVVGAAVGSLLGASVGSFVGASVFRQHWRNSPLLIGQHWPSVMLGHPACSEQCAAVVGLAVGASVGDA